MDEILALEEQRRIQILRERISGAIAEIEPRFRVDAFAEPLKRQDRHFRQRPVVRNDFRAYERQKILQIVEPVDP